MGIYKADKEHTELGQDKRSEIYLQKSLLTLKPKMLSSKTQQHLAKDTLLCQLY